MNVQCRPATAQDAELARRIHHAAYRPVVERQFGSWDEHQQDAFFTRAWDSAAHEILLVAHTPVGYCSVVHRGDDIHLAELVIDPQYQGRGVGTAVIRHLQAAAARDGIPIRLGTFHQNRARELYARLGFTCIGTTPTHVLMEWRPHQPTAQAEEGPDPSVAPTG